MTTRLHGLCYSLTRGVRNLYRGVGLKTSKTTLLLVVCTAFSLAVKAQDDSSYITVWQTDNPGLSANNQIIITATGSNFNIRWQEIGGNNYSGTAVGNAGTDTTWLTFPEAGTYQVSITPGSGTFTAIAFNPASSTDAAKLLNIVQWGKIAWSSFEDAYAKCPNLTITATDIPNLTNVTDMSEAFAGCSSLNTVPNMDSWNVSSVTNMKSMFASDPLFNQNIADWNVSHVTDMSVMFGAATSFNQSLNSWVVSSVTDMNNMFDDATAFNQPLDNWDVSHVTNMAYMFSEAYVFNQPLNWDVSSVTNMHQMFTLAHVFNQPLNNWDVSHVTDMQAMFYQDYAFNQPLDSWQTGNVTNMYAMFYVASAFDQNLGSWDLSSIVENGGSGIGLDYMFYMSGLSCKNYDSTLIGWAANSATPNGLSLASVSAGYDTEAQAAHDYLTNTKGWTINDAGLSAGCSALPVTLTSFRASRQGNAALLQWATSTEINNKGFEVQRSTDGVTWSAIGFVNSKAAGGNSTAALSYSFTDNVLANGINYYRLKQEDEDGKAAYSQTASVTFGDVRPTLYPNPAHGTVTIGGLQAGSKVAIYDVSGRLVKNFTATSASQQVDISNLAAGVYFVKIAGDRSLTFIVK